MLAERAAPPARAARRGAPAGRARLSAVRTRRRGERARPPRAPPPRAALAHAIARPARVLAVAFVLAAAGWALDTQTRVESDIQKLVPQDLPALRDLDALQRSTGVGGEVDVIIEGADLTRPAVLNWMIGYQTGVLKRFRYSAPRGCGTAELCPAFSLPDLFTTPASRRDAAGIRALLDAVPPYFSQSVVSADRRTATLAFGIRLMDLERQKDVIEVMRARLAHGRPAGVRAQLAGPARAGRRRERRGRLEHPPDADAARRACSPSRSCCSSRCAASPARSCRSCRSRSRPAGRRSCCSRCACR